MTMKAFVVDDGTEADVLQAILSRKLSQQQLEYDLEREKKDKNRPAIVRRLTAKLLDKKQENNRLRSR